MQPTERRVEPATGEEKRLHPGWICLLLAGLTLAVYWPVRNHDFVNYDDADYVTANAHVLAGLNWDTVRWALTSGAASNWHPLTWLSHALDCQLFGPHPGPQHLVSVAFHIINTLLVFLVFRRLTGATWRCAVLAGCFALHPLHVESVAWIAERKDVLSALFFLLTLGAYREYAVRRAWGWYAAALMWFALGLMSKPMLVTLPFVLLLLDWWPLGRLALDVAGADPAPAPTVAPRKAKRVPAKGAKTPAKPELCGSRRRPALPWRRLGMLLVEKAPFFALCAISSVTTFIVQRRGGAVSTVLSLDARLANAAVAYLRYLAKTFWPVNLSVLYPHPGHWPWRRSSQR